MWPGLRIVHHRSVVLSLSFASLALGSRVPAVAAPAGALPIAIQTCVVEPGPDNTSLTYPYAEQRGLEGQAPGGYPRQIKPLVGHLAITYRNVGTAPATRVTFAVTYDGQRQRVVDRGTFSPGVQIAHTFATFRGTPFVGRQPTACAVTGARFADGSTAGAP